jgi:hypothetical protein
MAEGVSDNLMDYNDNGTRLHKYQWDFIHNPEGGLYVFQDEEEGAAKDIVLANLKWVSAPKASGLYLSPAIYPIWLNNVLEVAVLKTAELGVDTKFVATQAIYGFKMAEVTFTAEVTTQKFAGYKEEGITSNIAFMGSGAATKAEISKSGYAIELWNIEGNSFYREQIDNGSWFPEPASWKDYTAAGELIAGIDDYTFLPCGYLLRDYLDSPIMDSHVLKTAIFKDPCILDNPFVPTGEGLGYETEFMKGLNAMVNAGLAVAFAPVIVEFVIVPALEAAVPHITKLAAGIGTEEASRRAVQAGFGVTVDATMQAAFSYYFELEDDERTWENAIRSIDPWQVGASGVESAFDKAWLEMVSSCVLDASFDNGKFTRSFDSYSCLKGALSAALAQGAFKGAGVAFKKLKALSRNNPVKFKAGLKRLGISKDKWDDIVARLRTTGGKVVNDLDALLAKLKTKQQREAFTLDFAKFDEQTKSKFFDNPELVESWKVLQNAPDLVRRNTSVLDEVAKLRTKTLANGDALDIQKLFDNGFGNTLNSLSDADKTTMLARMNDWDAKHVDDLARRLGKDNYPELADDLTNPDFFKLYDDIVHDPENAIDIAKRAGDGNLHTTAKSTFFNNVTQLGKDFEKVVAPALKPGGAWRNKLKTLLKDKFGVDDLDSYEMFEQVQLTYNKTTGDYFVADQVFVKYKTVAGRKTVDDMIIIENKLSDITKLTDNQKAAKEIHQYWTRGTKIGVGKGDPAFFKDGTIKWVRAYGSGDGKTIADITDIFK